MSRSAAWDEVYVPPMPAQSLVRAPAAHVPRCPALRTAQYFSRELALARDKARRDECYANMIAALLAKDGL